MGNDISVTYINHYKNRKETFNISYNHKLTCLELTQKIIDEINLKNYLEWNMEKLDILVKERHEEYYQIIEKKDRERTLMKWKYLRLYHGGAINDFIIKYPRNYF